MERQGRKVLVGAGNHARQPRPSPRDDAGSIPVSGHGVLAQLREAERSADRIIKRLDEIHEMVQRSLARENSESQ
jgi:hypothetical protein